MNRKPCIEKLVALAVQTKPTTNTAQLRRELEMLTDSQFAAFWSLVCSKHPEVLTGAVDLVPKAG